MISRATLFDMKLPYPLNEMVKDAFIHSSYERGYTAEQIYKMLHQDDVELHLSSTMSEILMAHFEWASTKEGHEFWKEIHNKLKQIEEQ
jgi:hypothetical protein